MLYYLYWRSPSFPPLQIIHHLNTLEKILCTASNNIVKFWLSSTHQNSDGKTQLTVQCASIFDSNPYEGIQRYIYIDIYWYRLMIFAFYILFLSSYCSELYGDMEGATLRCKNFSQTRWYSYTPNNRYDIVIQENR